ncbi:polyprenyl synthetase family protein [Patescibacteria group bacterium]
MGIKAYLADYRKQANLFLDRFFQKEIDEAKRISPLCREALEIYREFMRGGKMARGALTCLGYQSAGGKNQKAIIQASVAVEIIHSFLLIHDDWIDGDLTRRGKPTVYTQYGKLHAQRIKKGEGKRWAASMAITLGDVGNWLGYLLLSEASFPADLKIKAMISLGNNLKKTGYGQFLDFTYDLKPGFDWNKILKIRKLKTAYYTLVMPLQVGICLAGGSQKQLNAAEKYGFPVGIAFQIQDDYLGFFGDETKTGKSASADLREGKKTLLIARALEVLKGQEKKRFKKAIGNRKISSEELGVVRKLLLDSGVVGYCQQIAEDLAQKGKKEIPSLSKQKNLQETYSSLADYLVKREK